MKLITFDNIKSLNINPVDCYNWVVDMIAHKSTAILPAKTHMDLSCGVFCNVMPSIIKMSDCNWGGVKIVTRYPQRSPSLDSKILLWNADSGEFLALLDGNWITAMRTGAVAAHSINCFAKQDFYSIGIIGLGNVARSTLLVLASVIKRKINIKLLKYKNQAELFIERFKEYKNLQFTIVNSVQDLIVGSDVVISCATYFENNIACDEWFDEGVLLLPIHTRGFLNCDLFFDKIYADDTSHVAHFKYFNNFKHFAEVSDYVCGQDIGRENNQERILVYNIGLSIHDIYYASHIYKEIMKRTDLYNSLVNLRLEEPTQKFWI